VQEVLNTQSLPQIESMKRSRGGDVTLNVTLNGEEWTIRADRWNQIVAIERQS